MTLKGHYALCFDFLKHVRLSKPTAKIWIKIDPYYQRRRCSTMTRFWQYRVYADIRGGSQDVCKFSLDLHMPAPLDTILGIEDVLISWFLIILVLLDVALLFVCCLIHCKHLRLSDVNKYTYLLTYLLRYYTYSFSSSTSLIDNTSLT